MIRPNKPVKLLEWGKGTTTMNQRWEEIAEGKILSYERKSGVTNLVVEIKGALKKTNLEDDSIKVAQPGEGMAPLSERWGKITPRWGEVAMGKLKAIENKGSSSCVSIEIDAATKYGVSQDF